MMQLNDPSIKIITVEDPVEYQLPGLNQMQMNPQIGLTFADGLRHILRQDPDVILVGEIRDRETAEIAIQAAQTGHLVLSTAYERCCGSRHPSGRYGHSGIPDQLRSARRPVTASSAPGLHGL